MTRPKGLPVMLGGLIFLTAGTAWSAENAADLTALSLEELMQVEVFSASKKLESVWETPAAAYVLTQEDIRRSGATTIPELLRSVPGVSVNKVDANTWDISARGFNGSIFANKLLVMIDGRSVYTPLYGGVFWDVQDVVLEDVDRIEIIRGPGGTLWGANAVNGVINVITKRAQDTQGLLVTTGGGTEEQGFGTVRYGGVWEQAAYRGYVKFANHDNGFAKRPKALGASDDWRLGQGGFRADVGPMMFLGELYGGRIGDKSGTVIDEDHVTGGHLLARYAREALTAQLYWDRTNRRLPTLAERRDRVDMEFSHRFTLPWRQEIEWGAGYRLDADGEDNTPSLKLLAPSREDHLASVFIQDEIEIIEGRLRFIGGTKLEYNTYSGFEVQPSARLLLHLNDANILWAAISRAVRTPSRLEADTVTGILDGDNGVEAENLLSYEVGYRTHPMDRLTLEAAAFYNTYTDLMGVRNAAAPFVFANSMEGEVYGTEVNGTVQMTDHWRLRAGYTFTQSQMHVVPGSGDTGLVIRTLERGTPRHMAFLHSALNLPHGVECDAALRYSDALPFQSVPPDVETDLRLGWIVNPHWEVAVVGQNLVEAHHEEANSATSTEVERSVYGKVTFRY